MSKGPISINSPEEFEAATKKTKSPREKAAAYDKVIAHLRWSFDYWMKKREEHLALKADTGRDEASRFAWLAHEHWNELQRAGETEGRVCLCTYCRVYGEQS